MDLPVLGVDDTEYLGKLQSMDTFEGALGQAQAYGTLSLQQLHPGTIPGHINYQDVEVYDQAKLTEMFAANSAALNYMNAVLGQAAAQLAGWKTQYDRMIYEHKAMLKARLGSSKAVTKDVLDDSLGSDPLYWQLRARITEREQLILMIESEVGRLNKQVKFLSRYVEIIKIDMESSKHTGNPGRGAYPPNQQRAVSNPFRGY